MNSRQRLQDRLCRRNIESVNQILQSIHVKATEMKIRANSKDDLEDVIERLSERARNKLKEVKGDRQQY